VLVSGISWRDGGDRVTAVGAQTPGLRALDVRNFGHRHGDYAAYG
jgi:hypothetical protein